MLKELFTKIFPELLSPKKGPVAVLHTGSLDAETRHVKPSSRNVHRGRQEPSSAPRNNWRAIKPS